MNTDENLRGTWIQRLWWSIRDFYRFGAYQQLKPCRFSILVALIACSVFLRVAQGTEILRVVGEGMAGGQWYLPRIFGFFGALILWSICSWYAARVLFYFDFPGSIRTAPDRSHLVEIHVPRVLGIAPFLIVGCGFLVAAHSYDWKTPGKVLAVFLRRPLRRAGNRFLYSVHVSPKMDKYEPESRGQKISRL